MNELLASIISNFVPILGTVIAGLFSYIGLQLKRMMEENIIIKEKETIVASTVNYVEQISKNSNLSSAEKFQEAKEKALSWMKEKNIKISDTELDIMIECAVKNLKQK